MSYLNANQEEKSASIVATVGSPQSTREYADFLDGSGNSVPSNEELKLQQAMENDKHLRIHIERTEIIGTMSRMSPIDSDHELNDDEIEALNDDKKNMNSNNNDTKVSNASNISTDSLPSKSSFKASTYSNDRVPLTPGMAATYTSEYYESATRGSIDETSHISGGGAGGKRSRKKSDYGSSDNKNKNNKNKNSKSKKHKHKNSKIGNDGDADGTNKKTGKEAQTWTNRYTSMMIDQQRVGGWDELFNIEKLFELNMIGDQEYQDRRQKLINQLTGTKLNKESQARFNDMFVKAQAPVVKRRLGETDIIKEVPNWLDISEENAICHSCHIIDNKEEWTQEMRVVKMARNPFNNGTLRYVYYMMDMGAAPIEFMEHNNNNKGKNESRDNRSATTAFPPNLKHGKLMTKFSSKTTQSKTVIKRKQTEQNNKNKNKKKNTNFSNIVNLSNNNSSNNHDGPPLFRAQTTVGFVSPQAQGQAQSQSRGVHFGDSPIQFGHNNNLHHHGTHGGGPGGGGNNTATQQGITAAHSLVTPLPATHVAKISIDPMEGREAYFEDVAMQKHAQRFADMFNAYEVPKKVGFLDCWVYELIDRTPHIYCGVEKYIEGDYNKYTNNWDWANVERSTPQAFSHFTYEASDHKILVCDLQGVADLYTDPQMHTFDGKGCGKGNMGQRGIDKFLSSHRCNAICRYLKLKITNAQSAVQGTLPNKQYMQHKTIETLPVSTQYTIPDTSATTSLLPSRVQESYDDDQGSEQLQYFPAPLIDDQDSKCKCCSIM